MPERFIDSHIRQVPLFKDLPPDQLKAVAGQFEARRYEPGEWIFLQNQPTQGLYIMTSGQAVLVQAGADGQQRQIGVMQSGQYVGHDALLADGVESMSLGVTQSATVLYLSRRRLMTLIAHHDGLRESLGFGTQHKPAKKFKSQRENEEVILITRRHWWAYMRASWFPLLLMVGLWALALSVQIPLLTIALFAISLVVPGSIMLYLYIEWRNDSIIITDERIIRITHTILTFTEEFNEISINSIQEANAEFPGIDPFARIFNYGTVELKTAGAAGNFILDFIPNPENLQDLILEDRRLYDERQAQKQRQRMRAELDRWIGGVEVDGKSAAASESEQQAKKQGWSPLRTVIALDDGGMKYRKHWLVWLRAIAMPGFLMSLSAIMFFAGSFTPFFQDTGIIIGAAGIVLFIIGGLWFYWADWDWRHDYYIVNDSMIILVHQRPLFLQNENDQVLLKQVDNVIAETSGLFRQIFRYGDVRLSLVGADHHKVFEDVPRPLNIQGDISRRQARLNQQQDERQAKEQRELIGEYLSLYHEASAQGDLPAPPSQPLPGQNPVVEADQQTMPEPPPPISPTNVRDRVRPPGIPRKRLSVTNKPTMTSGKPYQPPMERVRKSPPNRPPGVPPRRDS